MKEISAVTLASKAFLAGSVKGGKAEQLKTSSASFDSFLGTSSNKAVAVQSKTDTTQFKVNVSEAQSGNTQVKTEAVQPENGNVEQNSVQAENVVSKTDTVTDTAGTEGMEQVESTKAPVADEVITDEEMAGINEAIVILNQTIRDIVKDITGMDDEMLSNAMSALGLVETDLLDTSNLAKLVLMLNGSSDMTDLLANEYMMSQFNDISDALKDIDWEALTGMSQEEFMPILENMAAAADESLATDSSMAGMAQSTGAQQTENSIPVTVEYVEEESITTVRQAADTDVVQAAVKETAVNQTDGSTQEDASVVSGKEGQVVNTENSTEQSGNFNQSTDSQTDSQVAQSAQTDIKTPVHNEVLNGTEGFLQNFSQAVADVTGEAVPQQTNMQQMIDIVNQVVEQIKVTLGKETTSMQLQLNPESLGKVLISVSSNHGVMTANFTVQTEEAKEALQSQMYSLREALESRSLKVDAVEVEVSDFAFSQSNQADAQNQKEFEKGNGRRFRFNFDDSSEDEDNAVSSVQSQEREARPNLGSSIDFTA